MKHATACVQCRRAKKRCVIRRDQRGCSYCRLKGLSADCSIAVEAWTEQRSSQRTAPVPCSLVSLSPEANDLLAMQTRIDLVDLYLTYIHDRPQTIFHAPTLREQVRKSRTSEALLLALCSLGCRFSRQESLRVLEDTLTKACKAALHSRLASNDIDAVQACILVANLCAANLDPDGEALYFGSAICIARVMRLPESRQQDDAITREIKCRIWWTLFKADHWCSASLGLPRQMCDGVDDQVHLPIEEYVFQDANFGKATVPLNIKPGLWAYNITLVQVFARIEDLHRQVVKVPMEQQQIDERVSELAALLDQWEQGLPESIRFSPDTLQVYHGRGLGGTFIDMHLGFHYYATLLFFIHLDVQRPSTPAAIYYSQLCKQHALNFSQLLAISRRTPGFMMHTLLFEDDEAKRLVSRDGLLSNFRALLQLQKLWPSINSLISRLFKFQNACLRSVDDHTHRVDAWMSHLLLEYNLPPDSFSQEDMSIDTSLQAR